MFSHHVYELKYRLFYSGVSFIVGWSITYWYKYDVLSVLTFESTTPPSFIFTTISEVFTLFVTTSCFIGWLSALPYWILQGGCFFVPCLYAFEAKKVLQQVRIWTVLFLGLNVVGMSVVLPYSWQFFLGFETTTTQAPLSLFFENRLQDFLQFLMQFFFFFNSLFVIILVTAWTVTPWISRTTARKVVYITTFVWAGLITPPDLWSQLGVGIPVLATYEGYQLLCHLQQTYVIRATN